MILPSIGKQWSLGSEKTSIISKAFYNAGESVNVADLTCIAGQNGAGKTSLMELLKVAISSGCSEWDSQMRILLAWEVNNKLIIYCNLQNDLKFDIPQDIIIKQANEPDLYELKLSPSVVFSSQTCSKIENIQLILTTNSPLILSDILPGNVVFLDNGKNCLSHL